MAVEDRAKELNSLAEKIRGSFNRFNSQLKSISDKRKRISRNVAERKERRSKLKASASSFGRSVGSITSNVLKTPGDIFGKIISFASLFLLGALVNSIPKAQQQVDGDLEKTKQKSTKVGNFFTGMVSAFKGFFGAFKKTDDISGKTITGVNESSIEAEKGLIELENTFGQVEEGFDPSSLTTKDDEKEDDNTDDVPKEFKKPTVNPNNPYKNKNIKKNYEDVSKKLIDTDSYLLRDDKFELTDGEIVKFDKKLILKEIKERFGTKDLEFSDQVINGQDVLIIRETVITN